MVKTGIPTYDALMNPLIQALKTLRGSGTVEEITNKVAEIVKLGDEQLEVWHNPAKGGMTEVEYRLAWSRSWPKPAKRWKNRCKRQDTLIRGSA